MRSRFKGSKRVRKSNSFERIQNSLKHFVQNIDKIAIAKTGFCLILLIVFYFLSNNVYGIYSIKNTFEKNIDEFARF